MPKIDQGAIGAVGVPMVDLVTQLKLVRVVDEVAAEHQRLLAVAKMARRRVLSLRRGILAAAFSGQLTGGANELEHVGEVAEASART